MTLDDLSVPFTHLNRETLLQDWTWLIGSKNLPVLVTKAGDAFLQNPETGEVAFLDTVNGSCSVVASNGDEFSKQLADVDFVMEYFAVNLIAPLIKTEDIEDGKLYGWIQPPVLGGEFATENLEPTDIEVHFSIQGQIHNQVKDLPDGTPISDINIKGME